MRRCPELLVLFAIVALLNACGRPAAQVAPTTGQPAAAPVAQATEASPPATPAPTATVPISTATPAPTAAVPISTATPASTPAGPLATTAEGLPQSRTAEGYPLLGDPNAPVTLTMYSDFL